MSGRAISRAIIALTFVGCAGFGGARAYAGPAKAGEWWSHEPIERPAVPSVSEEGVRWSRTPIDRFIFQKLTEKEMRPSREAHRRTLIRRLYYDLIGLPPTPAEIDAFVKSDDPNAYDELVDRLLESKHYGERWARHWLDVVHYGDTHGYDKDKLRPNAYHYRDYVIRAFQSDKRYSRFVEEQIAGDILYPSTLDGMVAMGFMSAGPWDFIGHVEVPETKIDGRRARNLDRDDMVATAMNTFVSSTVQCARCHDHKFDPVTQQDYYNLQAVFAALDRGDREFDTDGETRGRRAELIAKQKKLEGELETIQKKIRDVGGDRLAKINSEIERLRDASRASSKAAQFGYHSQIAPKPDVTKWVQVDLGKTAKISKIVWVGSHDNFGGIGAGFGFPQRYKIEVSNDPKFEKDVHIVVDRTKKNVANPGVAPQKAEFAKGKLEGRFVRMTATRLALRANDYIFALAELLVFDEAGALVSHGRKVTSLDSIQQPVRWRRSNLVDGYYMGVTTNVEDRATVAKLEAERDGIIASALDETTEARRGAVRGEIETVRRQIAGMTKRMRAYVGWPKRGGPRDIRVLDRGDILKPGEPAVPGAIPLGTEGLPAIFDLQDAKNEGERRVALARWITDKRNPLSWRSIVNRVWHYHFGRGIVETPNDFGKMGRLPTHPELLDWLAAEFRDGDQSIKALHRLIVRSSVYRQASEPNEAFAAIDSSNAYLWRMNRRRLDAESLRDSVLMIAGKLNRAQFGPGFRDFVLEKTEHSPHFEYHKHDPDDAMTHRRSVYRFLVRSSQQPFMQTLDCADPSQMIDRRDESLTVIQALALLNNRFMTRMAYHFAIRLEKDVGYKSDAARVAAAFEMVTGREPDDDESALLATFVESHGLATTCRGIVNLNEFVFVD